MALTPDLGYFATYAALVAAYPAASVSNGTRATTGDQGVVYSNTVSWLTAIGTPTAVQAVPTAPQNVQAFAGPSQITVTFQPSVYGQPTSYTASCSGGSISGSASPLIITGLTNGTAYTVTVTASNSAGTSVSASAVNSVTPTATGTTQGTVPAALTSVTTGNLFAWYSADQLSSPPSNGNPLVSGSGGTGIFLNDASGNGWNITAAASPPTMVTSWSNSKPALNFNGTSLYLQLPFTTQQFNGQVTIFIVAALTALANGASQYDQHLFSSNQYNGATFDFSPYIIQMDTYGDGATYAAIRQISMSVVYSTTGSSSIALATPYAISATYGASNGGGAQYFSGTKKAGNLNAIASCTNAIMLAARPNIANISRFMNGRIAEVILFKGALSDADRHAVESYIGTKYTITMAVQ